MTLQETIAVKRVYFDGGTGTVLQSAGLRPGEKPESWNLTHPDAVTALHRAYFEAGCNIVKTNTFGVNADRFPDYREVTAAAIACAQAAADGQPERWIALDLGPTGRMLKPLGDLAFEDCVSLYAGTVREAVRHGGIDAILIETMSDALETKAAVLAAKENSDLPVFVTNVYDENGLMMTGADPRAMIAMLEGLGVDGLGMNCSLGPDAMLGLIDIFTENASVPILVNPNAGLPKTDGTHTYYDLSPEDFATVMAELARRGATVLGGCCGTTPEYLRQTVERTRALPYALPSYKETSLASSYTHAVEVGKAPVLIGERINPTGKPRLKEAILKRDMTYIVREGLKQAETGVQVLDVNVGLPGTDEPAMMEETVCALQAVTDLPLQIDSSSPAALARAMRVYAGKPFVNSVNGKQESLDAVLPLVRKYGGLLIALTLDESGIPDTAEGRFAIAERILREAARYGIRRRDIVVDPLALTISANPTGADVTLQTLRLLRKAHIRTSLGVSNISFGLPRRELINAAFFTAALENGLNCAILNPFAAGMMHAYYVHNALHGFDAACAQYIAYAQSLPAAETQAAPGPGAGAAPQSTAAGATSPGTPATGTQSTPAAEAQDESLRDAVLHGLREHAARLAQEALDGGAAPLDLIHDRIIPALNEIGAAFEQKRAFLPQLLLCAEAATAALEPIRRALGAKAGAGSEADTPAKAGTDAPAAAGTVVLATVRGDIHDIGKNIVRVLLESYGFQVLDLGRDVMPEAVRDCAIANRCRLVGLSALMTTTVPAMEETVRLLHETDPQIRVVVGGAVLNEEYARMIGADFYSRDAMDTVRYAQQFYRQFYANSSDK